MDLVASCRDKLAYFRIKELKDVLTQLGLAKQGKKQDLVDRILALLLDEQVHKPQVWGRRNFIGKEAVAKIIDDTYRKMQNPGATDLASKSHSGSEFPHVKPKEEVDSYKPDMKVHCLCGKSSDSESMVQCEDPQCRVWQHISCVIIPEKPLEGVSLEVPSHFYCEMCRINRADPFWVTTGHLLHPVKFMYSGIADGTITVQNVERTFQLSRSDKELLQRPEYDLQVWCLLLNDKVPFRMQWPQQAELQVNGDSVRVVTRPGSQLLGINGRDDGPVITTFSKEGINKIVLSRCDARIFCFGIRLAKRRTVPQVLSLVPKEAEGETFQDALARVCRCIGGGAATENADSDSDIEVVAESVAVNLRCPMSGSRIRIAGRFKPCVHMGCFDLGTFVELNRRSRKWQCPICLKNYSLENIIIDPYFNRISSMLQSCGEDVTEIDVKPDGTWRVKNELESTDLSKWHLPDGTLCAITDADVKPHLDNLRYMNEKSPSDRRLRLDLGMKPTLNGRLEDSRLLSSESPILGRLDNHHQNLINMSSSATGSYKDGEDPSVNQDVGGTLGLSLNNGHEFDSFSLNLDPTYGVQERSPAPVKDTDVIFLSDSDEDNLTLISPEPAYDSHPVGNDTIPFPNHPGVSERYSENTGPETSGTSFLELFNNTDEFGIPIWPMQTCPQSGPGFQLFGTEVADVLADTHSSLGCAPVNDYGLTPTNDIEDTCRVPDLSNCHTGTGMQGSLVDNPLAFANDDPSLQIFLPNQPVGVTLQDDLIDGTDLPNGINSDDWISLRLAAGGGHGDSVPSNGLTSRQQVTSKETRMDLLDDAASLLLSMNNNEGKKANSKNQRSVSPGQPRSVRPRLYLSIDTDSD
ncbi:E3 SUMO-protein ligase SIZ1-like [Musa acuminata AAA Group]|uniref:E3 SUMO-protein ligase SIZ1-like n=1 Tax=Musa acuminata AAA Group TaxID=214697 RepID=UPI0031D5602D